MMSAFYSGQQVRPHKWLDPSFQALKRPQNAHFYQNKLSDLFLLTVFCSQAELMNLPIHWSVDLSDLNCF